MAGEIIKLEQSSRGGRAYTDCLFLYPQTPPLPKAVTPSSGIDVRVLTARQINDLDTGALVALNMRVWHAEDGNDFVANARALYADSALRADIARRTSRVSVYGEKVDATR